MLVRTLLRQSHYEVLAEIGNITCDEGSYLPVEASKDVPHIRINTAESAGDADRPEVMDGCCTYSETCLLLIGIYVARTGVTEYQMDRVEAEIWPRLAKIKLPPHVSVDYQGSELLVASPENSNPVDVRTLRFAISYGFDPRTPGTAI